MDYGKWRYQQQKKEDKSRASSRGGQLKELKFRTVKIGDHDLMRFALLLRELEQIERAFDVHVMCGHRRELGARREQRRQVKDAVHLEFGQDPFEEAGIADRSGELTCH